MTTATQSEPKTSGRVEANGIDYDYEIHGQGEPLLLLHGGLGSIDMFGPVLPILAEHREVIGVDLHGHEPQPGALSGEMAEVMKGTPMHESYIAVAPHPEDFPKLLDRIGEFMSKHSIGRTTSPS